MTSTEKLSRHCRSNKKHRQQVSQELDIIFDPLKHRTQFATRGLCTYDKIYYIEKEWTSVPLCISDCVSSKESKAQQNVSTQDLFIETLFWEAKLGDDNLDSYGIPLKFLELINREITNKADEINEESELQVADSSSDKKLWIGFGKWIGFKEPIKPKEVQHHLRNKWKRLQHALDLQNKKDIFVTKTTAEKKAKLIAEARKDFSSLDELVKFRYVVKPECITDLDGKTLIHLEQLNNPFAITEATNAINHYYFHTLNNPSHQSEGFWKNLIEHFGAYAQYNLLPYTSSDTASSHNADHLECVNNLLCSLQPLSNSINNFIQNNYGELYKKLSKLAWGPFAPRSFGVFPMMAINYNTISDYHWDANDVKNGFCCLVALGDFEGGELCFPQLKIVVVLQPGQLVAFSSRLLLHGNFPITRGIRHSVVYYISKLFFHDLRNFTKVYEDHENGIDRNANGKVTSEPISHQDLTDANGLNHLTRPKPNRASASSDSRRLHIDLTRAHLGLKAEDPLPSS
nr:2038_t:CDS:2 [Entrophospora candida]